MKVFVKYKHVACKNFTLKVLSEVFFMIFVFFCRFLWAIIPKFSDIFVHDKLYGNAPIFEKCYSYWAASDYHLRDGLRRPIRLQEMSSSPQNFY